MHIYRLRELMVAWERENGRRLSIKKLAEETGISAPTLSKMTSPDGYVTNTRHIESLCRFFNVTPNDLMLFEPPIQGP